jgi:hypothetical protein
MALSGQITGRVTSSAGAPVSGAAVISPSLFQATTTETGEYVLRSWSDPTWKPRLVIFHARGFRPLVKALTEKDSIVDAVLVPASREERRFHACSEKQAGDKHIGGFMRFAVPPGVKIVESHEDYVLQRVIYPAGGKQYVLASWEGGMCCSGRPLADKDVLAAAQTMRTWVFEGSKETVIGLDMRGTSADGTLWRWMGPRSGSQIGYQGATEAVARVFDAIIDSICITTR